MPCFSYSGSCSSPTSKRFVANMPASSIEEKKEGESVSRSGPMVVMCVCHAVNQLRRCIRFPASFACPAEARFGG